MAGRLVVIAASRGVVGLVVYIGNMHCQILRTKYENLNHGINWGFRLPDSQTAIGILSSDGFRVAFSFLP